MSQNDQCPICSPHPWHGLPCIRHTTTDATGALCQCPTAFEERP